MQTIAGGTVRYGDGLAWIECPDRREAIGECTSAGTLDVLWNGKPMESFDVSRCDYLLVADGATVAPRIAQARPRAARCDSQSATHDGEA